jgi:hypothetical protein
MEAEMMIKGATLFQRLTSGTGKFLLPALTASLISFAVPAQDADIQGAQIEKLARDVERAAALRHAKDLQYSLAHYAQFGLVDEIAELFTNNAVIELVYEEETVTGKVAIRDYWAGLIGTSNGLGQNGLFNNIFMTPTVTLNYDGRGVTGRWTELVMRGHIRSDGGEADWRGGTLVNDYILEDSVWKISRMRYYHQLEGPYYEGFFAAYEELPLVPYHYSPLLSGRPVPTEPGDTDRTPRGLDMVQLESRIDAMNAEDDIRNLQNIYGYYIDQKMWDDVADLFTPTGAMEIAGIGVYEGVDSIRRGLERDGPAGLQYGQINEQFQLHTIVEIDPNGVEANARGMVMGMLTPEIGQAFWTVSTFVNKFVKQNGKWRIHEMRIYPDIKADYYQGWHKSIVIDPVPAGDLAPDRPSSAENSPQTAAVIPVIFDNPVTGRPVNYPTGFRVVGDDRLVEMPQTDVRDTANGTFDQRMSAARRKLDVSKAYDAIDNLNSSFADYLDDWIWDEFSAIMADNGTRPQGAGFNMGRDNVYHAMTESHRSPPSHSNPRDNLRPHRRLQPVIHVTPDARTARLRTRFFLYYANHEEAGAFNTGMYPVESLVLEDGVWKFQVGGVIEQTWIGSTSWEDGWARRGLNLAPTEPHRVMPPRPGAGPRYYNGDISRPPAIPWSLFQDYFRASNARYPEQKPMWFHYRNPISGRTPPNYCPDVLSCFQP